MSARVAIVGTGIAGSTAAYRVSEQFAGDIDPVGGLNCAIGFERSDADLVTRSLETVFRLFGALHGTVDFTYVRRWPLALPHTRPGVYRAIGEFVAGLDPCSPIQFAGDYLSQTGQNTAVAWGNRAAHNILANVNPATLTLEVHVT